MHYPPRRPLPPHIYQDPSRRPWDRVTPMIREPCVPEFLQWTVYDDKGLGRMGCVDTAVALRHWAWTDAGYSVLHEQLRRDAIERRPSGHRYQVDCPEHNVICGLDLGPARRLLGLRGQAARGEELEKLGFGPRTKRDGTLPVLEKQTSPRPPVGEPVPRSRKRNARKPGECHWNPPASDGGNGSAGGQRKTPEGRTRVPPGPPPRFSPSLALPPGPGPTFRAVDGPMVRDFATVTRRKSKATLRHSSAPSRIATSFDRSQGKAETMDPICEEVCPRNGTPLVNTTMRRRFKPGQKSSQQALETSSTEPKERMRAKIPTQESIIRTDPDSAGCARTVLSPGSAPRSRPELI